jgi:tripartite-type tricarboxylate transporter receptor subunit TctC
MTNAIITSEMSNLAKGAYRTHDLEPVCQINASGSVLVIRSDLPVRTYAEFEEYARKNTLTAGHQGNGSANHFRLTMLSRYRNIPFTMVPYRGEADVINTLMGRHVDVAAVSPTTALRHLGSGQIRVLMSWDELHAQKYGQPIPLLKDIDPRIPDVGVKTYLWTRKTAPQEQIAALRSACAQVARDPAFEKEFTGAGFDLVYRSSEQVAEDLKRDIAHYQTILKEIGPTE